jgi:hypothetical protein
LIAISAAVLIGSFVVGSQLVQLSMAQDLGQMGEQLGQQAGERIGGALGGNQTGNQTGNQSGGGALGQLGEQAKSMLPGQ